MTMISYAQNNEDVLLSRVFPPGRPGFYIDVGANDPLVDSITKHFYDLGWRGINVEPASNPFERLLAQRERDVNLNVGLSDKDATLSFYEFSSGLPGSSTFSLGQAEWHHDSGVPFVERTVPVTTLAAVCAEHVTGTIDFLTIDAEGHERQVLEGGDWTRWRPRVVVVEATQPGTLIPSHDQWEHLLIGADYRFAAFDGLNRFYVRQEDADLLPALASPVNVCDDFVPFKYSRAISDLRSEVAVTRALNDSVVARFAHLPGQIAWFRAQYEALQGTAQTHREQYAAIRASLADLEGLYVRLEAEASVARIDGEELARTFEGIGPGSLVLARRIARASGRFPAVKKVGRVLVRGLRALRRSTRSTLSRH